MKSLIADGGEDAELLLGVLSLFESDLPCYRHTADARHDDYLSLIHVEIGYISRAIAPQRDITDRSFQDCVQVIQRLLYLFESFLNRQAVRTLPNTLVRSNGGMRVVTQ